MNNFFDESKPEWSLSIVTSVSSCPLPHALLKWQSSKGDPVPPSLANGKICYIELPATDIERSSTFYSKVFGWNVRKRGDGATAFDDTTGEVSGAWVLGRPPMDKVGILFYVMVDSVSSTIDAIVRNGGEIVQPVGADSPEITARFRDPGGNIIGLYQQPA
jgi:predicted enzyme related to lactoylglutathione lyase